VWGEDAERARPTECCTGESVEPVGIDHKRKSGVRKEALDETCELRVAAQARPDGDDIPLARVIREGLRHQFRRQRGDRGPFGFLRGDSDEARAGLERGEPAHRRRATFAAGAADHKDVAIITFVGIAPAGREQARELSRFNQVEVEGRVLIEPVSGGANLRDDEFARAVAGGREHLFHFGRGESDRGFGVDAFAVLVQAGRHVNADDPGARETRVDLVDPFEGASARRSGQPGAQQGVHNEGSRARAGLNGSRGGDAREFEQPVVGEGVARELRGVVGKDHIEGSGFEPERNLPGDGESVTAVVALPADDHDPLAGERVEPPLKKLDHAGGRGFHEQETGNSSRNGALVEVAHLGRGENFHSFLATTRVMSS
jgi:hypothetical protein